MFGWWLQPGRLYELDVDGEEAGEGTREEEQYVDIAEIVAAQQRGYWQRGVLAQQLFQHHNELETTPMIMAMGGEGHGGVKNDAAKVSVDERAGRRQDWVLA